MASLTSMLSPNKTSTLVVASNVSSFSGATQLRNGFAQHRVFVYGTLKRGYGNHELLSRHNAEFIGNAALPNHNMKSLGAFPAIYRTAAGYPPISGELFWVSAECLKALDILEGVEGGLYSREKEFILGVGDVFVYVQPYPKEEVWKCVTNNIWLGSETKTYDCRIGGPRPCSPLPRPQQQMQRPPLPGIPINQNSSNGYSFNQPKPTFVGKSVSLVLWPRVKEAAKEATK